MHLQPQLLPLQSPWRQGQSTCGGAAHQVMATLPRLGAPAVACCQDGVWTAGKLGAGRAGNSRLMISGKGGRTVRIGFMMRVTSSAMSSRGGSGGAGCPGARLACVDHKHQSWYLGWRMNATTSSRTRKSICIAQSPKYPGINATKPKLAAAPLAPRVCSQLRHCRKVQQGMSISAAGDCIRRP
jgi:hypothetical protein